MSGRVAVVILTWNHVQDTLECLDSLQTQTCQPYSTLIVDNGSSDDTIARVGQAFPRARIIANGRNLGYAEGNNVGLRAALRDEIDFVLVVNNDTILAPNCLEGLVSELAAHPESAAAAPKIVFHSAPTRLYYAGGIIHGGWHVTHRGFGEEDAAEFDSASETPWLTGCAVLMRRAVLERIGLFEPKFFLLFEDTDWSMRARRAGYTLRYAPQARLRHKASLSFGSSRTPGYVYYYTRNNLLWIERTFTLRQKRWMLSDAVRFSLNSPILQEGDPSPESRRKLKHAARRAIMDYGLRRFGKRSPD